MTRSSSVPPAYWIIPLVVLVLLGGGSGLALRARHSRKVPVKPMKEMVPAVPTVKPVPRDQLVPMARRLQKQVDAATDKKVKESLNFQLMRVRRSMTPKELEEADKL